MKRPFMVLVVAAIVAWQSHAQQQTPDQLRQEQRRQEQERRQAIAEDNQRQRVMDGLKAIPTSDLAKTAPPQSVEPCLKEARRHAFDMDEGEAPVAALTEWLAGGETTQIPWKIQLKNPELRIDQRYEVSYSVTVQGKDLESSTGKQELLYAIGGVES